MQSQRFLNAKEKTQPENRIFVAKSLALIDQLYHVMDELGWSQKRLAQEMGKSESEISKWVTGLHNFTFKSISKLEAVLGKELLVTPKDYQNKYTANVELHVRKVVAHIRTQFTSNTDLYAYETHVKVKYDGNTVALKNNKSYRFETANAWESPLLDDKQQHKNGKSKAA